MSDDISNAAPDTPVEPSDVVDAPEAPDAATGNVEAPDAPVVGATEGDAETDAEVPVALEAPVPFAGVDPADVPDDAEADLSDETPDAIPPDEAPDDPPPWATPATRPAGYDTGSWNGRPNYVCRRCRYATTDLERMLAHQVGHSGAAQEGDTHS